MNKYQLEKILDLARDYFISDISIIDCYNEYAEINGLSKIYLAGEGADKRNTQEGPQFSSGRDPIKNDTQTPLSNPIAAEAKLGPLNGASKDIYPRPSKILYDNINIQRVDMCHYAKGQILVGDLLFSIDDNMVGNYVQLNKYSYPVGISMNDVCTYKVTEKVLNYDLVPEYSKIKILIKGEVIIHLDPELKIPKGQKLYLNISTGKVGWRKTSIKYGKALNHQDVNGFVKVGVNFI